MRRFATVALQLLVLCGSLAGCRPNLEGAGCAADPDCPKSQYCAAGKCREGRRVARSDAGTPSAGDGGSPGGEDAGTWCDADAGCAVAVTVSPGVLEVGTQATLTATVRDGSGAPLPNVGVELSVAGQGLSLEAPSGRTDAAGSFSAVLSTTRAGTRTVQAVAGNAGGLATVVFQAGSADATRSQLTVTPDVVKAGGEAFVEVRVRDQFDNPLPQLTLAVTVTGEANVFTSTLQTDGSGAAGTTLSSTRAEAKTVTVAAGPWLLERQVTFAPAAPSGSASRLEAVPAVVDAGETTTLVLTVMDTYGNPVPGQEAAFSAGGTATALGDAAGRQTDDAGVLTTTLQSTVAEVKALEAVVGAAVVRGTATFTALAPDPGCTALAASPASVRAGESATLTLRACDVYANPVGSAPVAVAVTGTGNTAGPLSGSTSDGGVFTLSLSSTFAEPKTVTARVGGFDEVVVVPVEAGPPAAGSSSLDAGTASLVAGVSEPLTLRVRDAYGNPVPSAAVVLSSTGSDNAFAPPGGFTDAQGQFTASFSSTKAEPKSLTAAVGTGAALTLGASVTVVPGPLVQAQSTLALSSASAVVSGATGGVTVTFTARDAHGNPVGGQAVSVGVGGSSNALGAGAGTTNAAGVFTTTLSSTRAEAKRVTVQAGGMQWGADVTFAPGPVLDATSSLAVAPASLLAGESAAVTVTARDAYGNPVPGQQVDLSSSGSGNGFGAGTGTTDGAGAFTATFTSTRAESKRLEAAVGGVTLSAQVGVAPAAPSGTGSTLAASPAELEAGQAAALTLTVRDAFGNPVPSVGVTLSASGQSNALGASAGSTTSTGTFSTTLSSTRAEPKGVTATFGGTSTGATVTFRPGPAAAAQCALTVSPESGLPGAGPRPVELTVRDAYGNPVPGLAVSLSATGGATATAPAAPTDAQGKAAGTVESAVACTSVVTASSGGAPLASRTVTFLPPDAAQSTVSAPRFAVADGVTPAAVTVRVRDATSRPVPGATVTLAYGGSANVNPSSTTTDAAGVASFTVDASAPTLGTLAATAEGVTLGAAPTLEFLQSYALGGSVSGLTGPGLVLSQEGMADVTVAQGATAFTFGAGLASGAPYDVRVKAQPAGAWCNAASGTGVVAGAAVTGVAVQCHPRWTKVALGGAHALAIGSDGSLWAWGTNADGQLGVGDTGMRTLPVKVGDGYAQVAAGVGHSLGVKTDGSLWAWGLNANGQLGLNDVAGRSSPVQVGTGYAAVAAGDAHSLAVKADGTLWAFGANGQSQLGTNDTTQRPVPVQVGTGFASAAAGTSHSLGVKTDGSVWAWGLNASGQLGRNSTTASKVPVQVDTGYAAVAAAGTQSYGVKTNGELYAWGSNGSGRLGVGDTAQRLAPALVGSGYARISAGSTHSLGVKADGTLWAWGDAASGQLGTGGTVSQSSPVQVRTAVAVAAAGASTSIAVSTGGETWVFGDATKGALGLGEVASRASPVRVAGGGFSAVAGGGKHTLALKSDGTLWAFGDNTDGQLGVGDNAPRAVPALVGSGFTALSAGTSHSLGLKGDGTLWAWGSSVSGRLGLGTTAQRTAPALVGTGYAAVSAGDRHTLALRTDGTLWAWGDNGSGQLGLGDTTQRNAPAQVGTGYAAVAAGFNHSVAVKAAGTLWVWGNNDGGQLGLGDVTLRTSPFQLGVDTGFASLAPGDNFTALVKVDGALRGWGANSSGQLGRGNTTTSLVPVDVATGYASLAPGAGASHALGLKPDGTLWAWGGNGQGQLGTGAVGAQSTPAQVAVTFGFNAVARGATHSVALRDDGSVWAWGANGDGQLGVGVANRLFSPVPGP